MKYIGIKDSLNVNILDINVVISFFMKYTKILILK